MSRFVLRQATREALRAAEDARIEAVTASEQRRRLQYAASMQLADQLWHSPHGKASEIQELLVDWFPTDEKVDLRDFTWRHHWTRLHHGASHSIKDTNAVTIASDGNLVVADGNAIRKWDDERKSFTWLKDLPITDADEIRSLSPSGRWAAVENVNANDSGRREWRLIDLATGEEICKPKGNWILFSSDGQFALTWRRGLDEENEFWHTPTGKLQSITQEVSDFLSTQHGSSRGAIGGVAGPFLFFKHSELSGYFSNRAAPFKWDYPTYVLCAALSPDDELIADGKYGGDVHVRLVSSPEHAIVLNGNTNAVEALAFSPDSTKLAVGSREGSLDIWNISDVHDLPHGSAVASDNSTALLKRVSTNHILHTFKGHLDTITSITFAPDGNSVATRDRSGVAKLWELNPNRGYDRIAARATDLYGGKTGVEFEQSEDAVRVESVDAKWHEVLRGEVKRGDYVVGVTNQDGYHEVDKRIEAFDVQFLDRGPLGDVTQLHLKTAMTDESRDVALRRRFAQLPNTTDLVVSPDGTSITIADDVLGAVGLTTSGEPRKRYPVRGSSVIVSQEGHLLAFDGWRDLYVWDTRSDELLARFACRDSETPTPDNGYFGSLAFSPDGKHIAMGTGYRFNDSPTRSDLRVWEIATRTEISDEPLFKSDRVISNLTFTSDGKSLFALTHDGTIRMWDATSWSRLKRNLVSPVRSTAAMQLSPDGRVLAVGGGNGLALLDVESGDSRHLFREHDIYDVAFSSDGKTLVATTNDRKVMLVNAESGMLLTSLIGHNATVVACDFTQENDKLVTVDQNSNLRIWEAMSLAQIDADPASQAALYLLGQRQIQNRQFALAEQTLSYLLRLQQKGLPLDSTAVEKTKASLVQALQTQGVFKILREPQTQSVQIGDAVTLSVEVAKSQGVSYQWFFKGEPISDATKPSYKIEKVTGKQLGRYHVEITSPDSRLFDIRSRSQMAFLVGPDGRADGGLRKESFKHIEGTRLADLYASPKYPNQPDADGAINAFEVPRNVADNYGLRLTGFLVPPATGQYVFYLCSDDSSELFLSTDESPENKRSIARLNGWHKPREWETLKADNISAPVLLESGKRYWVEARYKDGVKDDHFAVTWQMPDKPPPKNGDPPIPGEYLEFQIDRSREP